MPEPAADAYRHDDFGPDADAACCAVHAAPALSDRDAYAASHCRADSDGNTTPDVDTALDGNAYPSSDCDTYVCCCLYAHARLHSHANTC